MAPVDGGGNVSRPSSPIPVTGQGADAPQVNVPVDDIYSIMNLFPFLDGRKSWRGDQNLNGYKIGGAANATAPQDYVTLAQVQALVGVFPGMYMVDTASSAAPPAGWVYANGQTLSRASYPTLWARVSAGNNLAATEGAKTHGQYGPGNGTTTFTIPNLYADGGYFIRPISSGRGIGTVQADEIKSHDHPLIMNAVPPHAHNATSQSIGGSGGGDIATGNAFPRNSVTNPTSLAGGHTPTGTVGPTGGTETRPKNIAYPVLIKT